MIILTRIEVVNLLQGTGVSPGIAIGKALLIKTKAVSFHRARSCEAEQEIARLQVSLVNIRTQLGHLKEKLIGQSQIIAAQILITQDPELLTAVFAQIEKGLSAETAWQEGIDFYLHLLTGLEHSYMAERVADLKDIRDQVLNDLLGIKQQDLSSLGEDCILVAQDLTPSNIASMDKARVLGFVTEIGGHTSHAAIMARSLEIPAIMATRGITLQIATGDLLIIDADKGQVLIRPSEEDLARYRQKKAAFAAEKIRLAKLRTMPTISSDGRRFELGANIGSPEDCAAALQNGAEGIGLFRTEFLYLNVNSLPTEDEQAEAYKSVLEQMAPRPVIIRTLDIGGDKPLACLNLSQESNPFLGYRAIRVCLKQQEVFRTQLRALLRASVCGNLKIMFPMISGVEELQQAKAILQEVKLELIRQEVPITNKLEVGMMIEVPAAALISDILAKEVDFFSIGTNDLVQYTLAVDRMNQEIAHLYSPFHPAVLRLVKLVIDNGHNEGIRVGMCGEAAGDPELIPLFQGMGLDEFSMSASSILPIRELIAKTNVSEQAEKAIKVLRLSTPQAVRQALAR